MHPGSGELYGLVSNAFRRAWWRDLERAQPSVAAALVKKFPKRYPIVALVALLAFAGGAEAQAVKQRTVAQSISTSGSDCSTATSCVSIADVFGTINGTFQLTGTFTGTAQFEGTLDGTNWVALLSTPLGTSTAVTSATAPGMWTYSAALIGVRVRASALSSGTIAASIAAR